MTAEGYERWRGAFAQTIAKEIKHWRAERGLSARQLCNKLEDDFGMPFRRSVLANLENGRRPALSIAELLLIARALDVSPMHLLFPTGSEGEVEIGPGALVSRAVAVSWFTGEDDGSCVRCGGFPPAGFACLLCGSSGSTPESGAGRGRRNRITSMHLADVATVYQAADRQGRPPTMAVATHFETSHSTAARWVGQARRSGVLPSGKSAAQGLNGRGTP